MKKLILIILTLGCIVGCTYYTEKQSETLSRNVYATSDSLNTARVDLANYYSEQTTRLVKSPKKRISIHAVYEAGKVAAENSKTRVIVVPEAYRNDKVVVVNSSEYQELLKDKAIAEQLKKDNENIIKSKIETDKELAKQAEYNNKMIIDLNNMQKKLVEKDLAILWRNIIIVGLLVSIGGYIYLRMNSFLVF
jgi:Pyruvate/2-oxoacid:ferredoxin oxidoreductase gamma subunit